MAFKWLKYFKHQIQKNSMEKYKKFKLVKFKNHPILKLKLSQIVVKKQNKS